MFAVDIFPKARKIRQKYTSKWGYIKPRSFRTVEIIKQTKRLPTESKKIFAYCISDKRLISKIQKENTQLTIKNINSPIKT